MSNHCLIIVESPAKSKTIKKFLGSGYEVVASMGHIRDLPKSQLAVDIDNDFEPKYINIRGKADLIKSLKKAAKSSTKVYLATDPDREGEAIAWHLAYLLDIAPDSLCRITFNEITKNAVKSAISSPRNIDTKLVDAQQARRILDRIVGYKISPLLWKNIKKGLSAGRVQSVALKLIVDRENEINNFVPKEYWSLIANLAKTKKSKEFEAKFYGTENEKIEINSSDEMDKILDALANAKYTVSNITKGEKKRNPYAPFTTSTLQQDAARKLGYPTAKTMMIAQQLYEGLEISGHGTIGLITYMRTDSTRISDEATADAKNLIINEYGKEFYPATPRIYKSKKNSQDAHEAIRPSYIDITPAIARNSLTSDQFKLYKLIWERFIASQMESAVFNTTSIDILANKYRFRANGSELKFQGFLKVYSDNADSSTQLIKLPDVKVGDILCCNSLVPEQHFTEPPARFSEASLVKTLEENGIGRPSTYAPTISTIISRGYILREKRILYPTELGTIVNTLLAEHFLDIINVAFTADMENKLDEIEEGNVYWKQIIRDFYAPFSKTLEEAEEKIGKVELTYEETDIPCDKCGKLMVIKQGKYGKFLACPGFPECRNAKPIIIESGVNCPICGGRVLVRKTKRGKKYFACENSNDCHYMIWETPTGKTCEKCGSFLCEKGKNLICGNPKCNPSILHTEKKEKKTKRKKKT